MPNPLQPYVTTTHAADTYKRIQRQLGMDRIIFAAMQQVAQRRGFAFHLPATAVEYPAKHQEIGQYLTQYQTILQREGLFFELIEEAHTQLMASGQAGHAERLRKLVVLETNQDFQIKISADGAWLVEWVISLDGTGDTREVFAVAYERNWHHVVPWSVVQYVGSGISLYKRKAYATALALMSIAVEATLRDVLSTEEYTYSPGASKADIYGYSRAQVDSGGAGYTLTFLDAMPLGPADLQTSAAGAVPVDVQIRRVINWRKDRVDLLVKAPPCLVDHWSGRQVVQQAQPQTVGGLGEALSIARDTAKVITPLDLPIDVDDVLKAVRNNLIHLSSDSLEVELPQLAFKRRDGRFTVKDFVNDPGLVFDLIADIPRFVNEQYVKLWKAGVPL